MLTSLFDPVVNFMLTLVSSLGYIGVFILTTIESTIIPFPLELILIPAGALVATGQMHWIPLLIAAILGSILGALINYYLAWTLGRKMTNYLVHRYGKLLFINESSVLASEEYFRKHGHITTFVGRLIPGIRSFVSLPAGFARMNVAEFCIFTGLGAGVWSILLILLGYWFGSNIEVIRAHLREASIIALIAGAGVLLLYWLVKLKKQYLHNH